MTRDNPAHLVTFCAEMSRKKKKKEEGEIKHLLNKFHVMGIRWFTAIISFTLRTYIVALVTSYFITINVLFSLTSKIIMKLV